MAVEQSLVPEASEVAIERTAVRSRAKLNANIIRLSESVNLREDQQDFQFRHFMERRGQKASLQVWFLVHIC